MARVEFTKENQKRNFAVEDITTLKPISDEERASMSERYGRDMSWAQTKVFLRGEDKPVLVRETTDQIVAAGLALVTLRKGEVFIAANVHDIRPVTGEEHSRLSSSGNGLNATFRAEVHFVSGQKRWSTVPPAQLGTRIDRALGRSEGTFKPGESAGPVGDRAEGGP